MLNTKIFNKGLDNQIANWLNGNLSKWQDEKLMRNVG